MKLWNSDAWRSLVFALLIAGWCTGWLWFLLALTRPLPGIISSKPGLGALELLEVPTGLSYPMVLAAIFLLCLLPPLLLGALRGWWDGKGRALEAMLWPLRSASFWLPCLMWLIAGIAAAVLFHDSDVIDLIIMAVSIPALLATPFLCLNPMTLDSRFLARWWRPGWPGWVALLICMALWTAYLAASFVFDQLVGITQIPWLALSLSLLDELVSAFVLVLAVAIWLNRGRRRNVQADLGRMARSSFIREYVWQNLMMVLIASAMAAPLLVTTIEAIFVIPQYEQWSKGAGREIPFWLRLQGDIYRGSGTMIFVAIVPFGLYLGFVQGRLMRLHGVGKGNPTD